MQTLQSLVLRPWFGWHPVHRRYRSSQSTTERLCLIPLFVAPVTRTSRLPLSTLKSRPMSQKRFASSPVWYPNKRLDSPWFARRIVGLRRCMKENREFCLRGRCRMAMGLWMVSFYKKNSSDWWAFSGVNGCLTVEQRCDIPQKRAILDLVSPTLAGLKREKEWREWGFFYERWKWKKQQKKDWSGVEGLLIK